MATFTNKPSADLGNVKFSGGTASAAKGPSQGTVKQVSSRTEAVNTTSGSTFVGDLAQGLNLFNAGITAADTLYKQSIDREARAETDNLNADAADALATEAGMTLYETPEGVNVNELPSEVRQGIRKVEGMTKAKDANMANESHYWVRAENISRQLRQRYPGHRDAIDKAMSKYTGRVPANALRLALRQEANAMEQARRSSLTDQQASREFYEKELVKKGLLWPNYQNEQGEFNFSVPEMRNKLNRINAEQTATSMEKSRLALMKDQGEATDKEALKATKRLVWERGPEVMDLITNNKALQAVKDARAQNRVPTTQELLQASEAIRQIRENVNQAIEVDLVEYRKYGDTKDIDEQKNSFMTNYVDPFLNSWKTGDVEALNNLNTLYSYSKDRNAYSTFSQSRELRAISGIASAAGGAANAAVAAWMSGQDGVNMSNFQRSIGAVQVQSIATGEMSFIDSLQQDVQNAFELDPQYKKQKARALVKGIADGDPETSLQLIDGIFTQQNKGWFKYVERDREGVFELLTSPDVAKRIKGLNDKGRQDSYIDWVGDSFTQLARPLADVLNKKVPEQVYGKVQFAIDNGQIKANYINTRNSQLNNFPGLAGSALNTNTKAMKDLVEPIVKKMNSLLRGASGAADIAGGNKDSLRIALASSVMGGGVEDGTILSELVDALLPPKPDGETYSPEELTPFFSR